MISFNILCLLVIYKPSKFSYSCHHLLLFSCIVNRFSRCASNVVYVWGNTFVRLANCLMMMSVSKLNSSCFFRCKVTKFFSPLIFVFEIFMFNMSGIKGAVPLQWLWNLQVCSSLLLMCLYFILE